MNETACYNCPRCDERKRPWGYGSLFCPDCDKLKQQCKRDLKDYLTLRALEGDSRAAELRDQWGSFQVYG